MIIAIIIVIIIIACLIEQDSRNINNEYCPYCKKDTETYDNEETGDSYYYCCKKSVHFKNLTEDQAIIKGIKNE